MPSPDASPPGPSPSGGDLLRPDGEAVITLVGPTARAARRAGEQAAAEAGLDEEACQDLAVALSELTTNAERHGRPPVTVDLWSRPGTVVGAVADAGAGPDDPDTGLTAVAPDAVGGRGLWIVRQLCDAVRFVRSTDGFTVRFAIGHR